TVEDESAFVQFGSTRLRLDPEVLARRPGLRLYDDRTLVLGIRPEDMEDARVHRDGSDDARLHGVARLVEALGAEFLVHFDVDAPPVLTDETRDLVVDDSLTERGHASFVARISPRSKVAEDDKIEFVIDTPRLHFFDLDTGTAITNEP